MGPGPHRPPQLVPPTTSSSVPLHTAACSRLAPGLPVVESGTQRSVSPTWADPDAGSRPTPSASRTAIPCVQATRQVYRRQFSHDSHELLTALGAFVLRVVTTEATRTNEQVRHDVQAELKWYAGVEPNEIGAAVKDGIVILGGWVDSYVKGWEAERAAVDALDGDALVPSESIKVSVPHGRVTLEGEVDRRYQKNDEERVVRRLTGVRGVVNQIRVKPAASPADEQVAATAPGVAAVENHIAVLWPVGHSLVCIGWTVLANLAVLLFSLISGPNFGVWGWRIPFLVSLLLVFIGLWIRLGIIETPTFQRLIAGRRLTSTKSRVKPSVSVPYTNTNEVNTSKGACSDVLMPERAHKDISLMHGEIEPPQRTAPASLPS
jgi:osmotically-inducible protein OsmY